MSAHFEEIYNKAHAAGMAALGVTQPAMMTVVDNRTGQVWHESEGMCGFAWVNVKPGTCAFAKWLKAEKSGYKDYAGGISIWVKEGGQSIERKTAYAEAFAMVLRAFGVTRAYANSRLD